MNKIILIAIAVAVIVGSGGFFGGIQYQKSKSPFSDLQKRFQEAGVPGGIPNANRNGGGFTTGEIISKDEKSITVKLRDGGSKMVFFSGSTEIVKSVSGSGDDLQSGEQVSVSGTQNSDGSITASLIQLRGQMSGIQNQE